MFDLKAGIHFQKVEFPRAVHDKFHRARTGIAHRLRQRAGLFTHRFAGRLVQKGRRGLFNHLLVSPLDRAFAFMQVNTIAMGVGQNLNFDMARLGDEFFDENPVIPKAGRRFVLGGLKSFARFLIGRGDAHPLATATCRSLDHHRIADLIGNFHRLVSIGNQPHMPRHRRNPGTLGNFL